MNDGDKRLVTPGMPRRPANALPRLILHAGLHKTATSAIQAFAYQNWAELRRRGLWYPDLKLPPLGAAKAHHLFAHAVANSSEQLTLEDARALAAHWAQSTARSGETVFLSAEPICRHVGEDATGDWLAGRRAYLRRLKDVLSGFDVAPVIVLRRQDDFIRSLFQENVMKRTANGSLSFAAYRNHDRNPTRFLENVSVFEEVFAKVTVLAYEDLQKSDRFCGEFFDAIGVDVSELPPGGIVRKSLSAAATLVKQFLNPHITSDKENRTVIRWLRSRKAHKLLATYYEDDGADLWETQEARAGFLSGFDAENEALRARYFPFRDWIFPALPRTHSRPASTVVPRDLQEALMIELRSLLDTASALPEASRSRP